MISSVEYVEKTFKEHLKSTLEDVIEHVNNRMTRPERGRFLILLAKELMVNPENLVVPSLNWKTDCQSSDQTPKKEVEG